MLAAKRLEVDELKEIKNLARNFLQNELAPHVSEFDEREEFPFEIYQKFLKTGLPILNFPEAYGGTNSLHALSIVAEEMGKIDSGFALSVLASSQLFGYNVLRMGTEAQKEKYIGGMSTQSKLGCWALTEPETGSNALGIQTRAKKVENGYLINGSKTFATNAPIADYFIVLCREFGEGIEGGTAFLIDRGQKGMELGTPLKKLGHRTSPTGELFFNDCEVSESQVLGKPGQAFFDMMHSLDLERMLFSGIGVGIMKGALERALKYSCERKQFGQPISNFQLVQEKIASMSAKTELIETYGERVFERFLQGKSVNKEAAVLKYMGAEMCVEVANDAVQLLGGNGYMREYEVEKGLRDARLFPIGGGTTEINKLIVAKNAIKTMNELS